MADLHHRDDYPSAPCCPPKPAGHRSPARQRERAHAADGRRGPRIEQCVVPAQTFRMGDAHGDSGPLDGERPVRDVRVERFSIDATTVTNADFSAFVDATGYVTEAEQFGSSAVFGLALTGPPESVLSRSHGTPWWLAVRGAHWRTPGGPGSSIAGLDDHPVVQVSWYDAIAYCRWAARRLPTEAEWECAARAGQEDRRYPWGDELDRQDRCNIWQGSFPHTNTLEDGYLTTAPVRTYEPNGYGLWQTIGNVWEWCADWWVSPSSGESPAVDRSSPSNGRRKLLRGGSHLCHDSYCNRYRLSARSANTPDSSAGNVGFRTVALP